MTSPDTPAAILLDQAYALCLDTVRRFDPDRYFACLFVPRHSQAGLFALYAFNAEVARIRESVSEPMPGEIRHQWWREALSCNAASAERQNPIAAALLDTMRRCRLPPEPFLALLEARSFDLYDDPMPTWLDLEGYCGETSSALIRLASLILTGGEEAGSADLCGYAGVTYAITGLLRAFPHHARRKQCFLPHEALIACGVSLEDLYEGHDSEGLRAVLGATRGRARQHLATLRSRIGELDRRIRPAFYPVALVEPYLDAMEVPEYRPFETRIDLSALSKLWRIGKNAWLSRRG